MSREPHLYSVQSTAQRRVTLAGSRPSWPFVALGYADDGYPGRRVAEASPIRIKVACNCAFATYDEIVAHCCEAWNTLVEQRWHIISIGMRDWAHRH